MRWAKLCLGGVNKSTLASSPTDEMATKLYNAVRMAQGDASLKEALASTFIELGIQDVDLSAPVSKLTLEMQLSEIKNALAMGAPLEQPALSTTSMAIGGLIIIALAVQVALMAKRRLA